MYNKNTLSDDNSDFYKVFNRDFSNGYLLGDINRSMFIDNPRDNSIKQLSEISNYATIEEMHKARLKFYEDKAETSTDVPELTVADLSFHNKVELKPFILSMKLVILASITSSASCLSFSLANLRVIGVTILDSSTFLS